MKLKFSRLCIKAVALSAAIALAGTSYASLTAQPSQPARPLHFAGLSLAPNAPAASPSSAAPGRPVADGAAFVRLRLSKRNLYVGETVPVKIQVGLRAGVAASLEGLPALSGDAFTLNKLAGQPDQSEEILGGNPYTILTWHSALAAVKPGDFPLTVETPVTVTIHTAPQRKPRTRQDPFGDPFFDDIFNDSIFQEFFGGTTEKELTLTSDAQAIKVQPLPAAGRPAGFSGAVGDFQVRSELSAVKTAGGDPVTLFLKVQGSGSFDRVNSAMLGHLAGWKTYKPSAKFSPADTTGYGGEKVFEQAIIPTQAGSQTVPALTFSFFNPETQSYQTLRTASLNIDVSPEDPGSNTAATSPLAPNDGVNDATSDGLRPDHAVAGGSGATLRPLYFQAWYILSNAALLAFVVAAWLWLRHRTRVASDAEGLRRNEAAIAIAGCLGDMDAASAASDAERFFHSARAAFQHRLASQWRLTPTAITTAEIDARLNGEGANIRSVFALADQAAYSGQSPAAADFQHWKQVVRDQLAKMDAL